MLYLNSFQDKQRLSVFAICFFILTPCWAVPVLGQKAVVSSASKEASEAGLWIAKKGGNAVDIAVATMLALSVTRPYYAALGGGGFALIKMGDKIEALDFRETAPTKTNENYFLNKNKNASMDGGTAVGVPGLPMGLWELHKKYGKLHWSELFAPAISLASKGFNVTGEWAETTTRNKDRMNASGKAIFLKKQSEPYKPGDIMTQPQLAKLLKELGTRGIKPFYEGLIARDIFETVQEEHGDMSFQDLKAYKARWLEPLKVEFKNSTVFLMPPPSSGGVVIGTALALAQKLQLESYKPLSLEELHLISEILSRSFRGRALLGDPSFSKNPTEELLSEKYIQTLANSISMKSASTLKPLNLEDLTSQKTETTHISVMTNDGKGVAMTVTLNGGYGSGVVSRKFGVVLNNEMDDFTTRPNEPNMFGLIQGKANLVQAGKRPLSSMSPTLVFQDGKLKSVIGAPGGPKIISAVFQTLYRTLANGWNMDKSIQAPRVHHQFLPNKLFVDPQAISPDVLEGLRKRGHEIAEESNIAKVYGVQMNKDGLLEGASDARGDGDTEGF